ncbi:hypothetical protein F2Q69_00035033 [Brassica cretica]|uniref:Uncharacterized protein n=1 Tax=Brassica cretica TaxID=69181 RepID=A0A8S9SR90_BRACR|nr:hypothetical protein F2Q69_00035033 [Brassica cretica]
MTTAVRSPDTTSAHYFVFELQSVAEELKRQGSDKVDSSSSMCLPFFRMSFQTPQIGHACTELLDKKTNKIRGNKVLIENAYCLSLKTKKGIIQKEGSSENRNPTTDLGVAAREKLPDWWLIPPDRNKWRQYSSFGFQSSTCFSSHSFMSSHLAEPPCPGPGYEDETPRRSISGECPPKGHG